MCGCNRDSVDVCSQTEVIAHGALESGVGEFFLLLCSPPRVITIFHHFHQTAIRENPL